MSFDPIKDGRPVDPAVNPSKPLKLEQVQKVDQIVEQLGKQLSEPPLVATKSSSWWPFSWHSNKPVPQKEPEVVVDNEPEPPVVEDVENDLVGLAQELDSGQPSIIKIPLKNTIEKTEKVKSSWLGSITSYVFNTQVVQNQLLKYASEVSGEKEGVTRQFKNAMIASLKDPQFVECYELMKSLIVKPVGKALNQLMKDNLKTGEGQLNLIEDILEMNLAHGFANLAKEVAASGLNSSQPTLGRIISHLCDKGGQRVSRKDFVDIEEKYKQNRLDMKEYTKQLFPDIASHPELQEKIATYHSANPKKQRRIRNELFPQLESQSDDYQKTVDLFLSTLTLMGQRRNELLVLFSRMSEDILSCLFPNKFNDMNLPFAKYLRFFPYDVYTHHIQRPLTEFLLNTYEPLEGDSNTKDKWKKDLQDSTGMPDVDQVIKAPTALLKGFLTNYIQSDKRAIDLVAHSLASLQKAPVVNLDKQTSTQRQKIDLLGEGATDQQILIETLSEAIPKARLATFTLNELEGLAQLSSIELQKSALLSDDALKIQLAKNVLLPQITKKALAEWILESVQSLLHHTDPSLGGVGDFLKQTLSDLTLGLMAKAGKLAIPDGETVNDNHFFKIVIDRLLDKYTSLQGTDIIPAEFWPNFLGDLPLPPFVKDLLIPVLIQKTESLHAGLKKNSPAMQKIDDLFNQTQQTILTFENGRQLLSMVEKVSSQIVEGGLEKNIGLVSMFGFGDSADQLIAEYLPGIKFDDKFQSWLKGNISALGSSKNGQSPQSIALLKKGIQAVLHSALIETIQTNFKNNSKDYAEQLLKNLQNAFTKALGNQDKVKFDQALKIQSEIQTLKDGIRQARDSIESDPQGILPAQHSLLQELTNAYLRQASANTKAKDLENERNRMLDLLNTLDVASPSPWTVAQVIKVPQALLLKKKQEAEYPTHDSHIKGLQDEIQALQNLISSGSIVVGRDLQEELNERKILLRVLEMDSESLQLVSNIVTIESTVRNSKNELAFLKNEYEAKEAEVNNHDSTPHNNKDNWDQAVIAVKKSHIDRHKLEDLSAQLVIKNKALDSNLTSFQNLASELSALIGLSGKDKLKLPSFVLDLVWPTIETAKNESIARFLFDQISPLLQLINEISKAKDDLKALSQGDDFFGKIAHFASVEAIGLIPSFLTSYKPFAQDLLKIVGINTTPAEVLSMETALKHEMIKLGKANIVASMLKPLLHGVIPSDKEDAVSLLLEQLIAASTDKEFSKDQVLLELKKEITTTDPKDIEKLEHSAKLLASALNRFLLNRGKVKLKPEDLLNAYQGQVTAPQQLIQAAQKASILQNIEAASMIEKIGKVVITPEEIAQTIENVLPGATDLHSLIAPQLQQVIVGNDQTFKDNKDMLQKYVEGLLLQVFVKAAKANQIQGRSTMEILTSKLRNLPQIVHKIKYQNSEEVAHEVIDEVLKEILGIVSEKDLEGIPLALQRIAYEKIKEQAYQRLTIFVTPIVERAQNEEILKGKSGSNFLSHLTGALAHDFFSLLPRGVGSFHEIAKKMLVELSGQQPADLLVEQYAEEIKKLVDASKQTSVSYKSLIEAYIKVTNPISADQQVILKQKLKKEKFLQEINAALFTPEKIVAQIKQTFPHFDQSLEKELSGKMLGLFHKQPAVYQNVSAFLQTYVEGILLKAFIRVADKNPCELPEKDTVLVLTEKLLKVATDKYASSKGRPLEDFAKDLEDSIMATLGIDSPDAFDGLPDQLKLMAFENIKGHIKNTILKVHDHLKSFEDSDQQVQDARKASEEFDKIAEKEAEEGSKGSRIGDKMNETYLQIFSQDLANMVVSSGTQSLLKKSGAKSKGVNTISLGVTTSLEELSRGNLDVATLLLKYAKAPQLEEIVGQNLEMALNKDQLVQEKQKASHLIGNMFLVFFNRAAKKMCDFEENNGKEFTQKLMAKLLLTAANHLKTLNQAKKLAATQHRTSILHEDFVKASGAQLDPGVPREPISFEKSVRAIGDKLFGLLPEDEQNSTGRLFRGLSAEQEEEWLDEEENLAEALSQLARKEVRGETVMSLGTIIEEIDKSYQKIALGPLTKTQCKALKKPNDVGLSLKDLIRTDQGANQALRKKESYDPAAKNVMKMLFPNGKKDLTFLPEGSLRDQVWLKFKTNLFPTVISLVSDLLIDPDLINSLILSSLESATKSLKAEIIIVDKPEDHPLDALDQASGELLVQTIQSLELPERIKKAIINPKTGELYPEMKKTIGASLRKQLDGEFIKKQLGLAFQTIVKGESLKSASDRIDPQMKKAAAAVKRKDVLDQIKAKTYEVVDLGISYSIKSKWALAQKRFDKLVQKRLGRIGMRFKKALDLVFRLIFFKLIGGVLSFLLGGRITKLVKKGIYSYISLDKNREIILGLLTKKPDDQPKSPHVVYHEDLIHKFGRVLKQTVAQAVPPVKTQTV